MGDVSVSFVRVAAAMGIVEAGDPRTSFADAHIRPPADRATDATDATEERSRRVTRRGIRVENAGDSGGGRFRATPLGPGRGLVCPTLGLL